MTDTIEKTDTIERITGDLQSALLTTNELMATLHRIAEQLSSQHRHGSITPATYAGSLSLLSNTLRISNRKLIIDLAGFIPLPSATARQAENCSLSERAAAQKG
jgi:hypothetical protein